MKIQTLLLALVVLTWAATARSQDFGDAVIARAQDLGHAVIDCAVPLLRGNQAGIISPSCGNDEPKNYAEETACADGTCGCCSRCCHQHDVWGSVEFLMWWAKGTPLPPLVTTSDPGTPRGQAGILGLNSTDILFGNEIAAKSMQGGGRVTFGLWLDPEHNVTAGGRFFGLAGDTTRFSAASAGGPNDPILARPFFNALLNQPDALTLAYPGAFSGSVDARLTTNNIIGADAFTEIMMGRDNMRRVDLVAGYEFFRLNDWLQVNSQSTNIDPASFFFGVNDAIKDRFTTRNQFHGGLFGLRGRMAHGQWSLNVLGQVGLGNMNQQAVVSGTTAITTFGNTVITNHGFLAQPSNIGTYERNVFCAIPQFIGNLNYHVSPSLSFHIGYSMVFISNVALSGDQVDLHVNIQQPVGPARPQFVFHDREYWLQGINWGMNWDF